jgi:hypothetical protein
MWFGRERPWKLFGNALTAGSDCQSLKLFEQEETEIKETKDFAALAARRRFLAGWPPGSLR